ncbi:hypothetical protein ECG_06387 [Echinococcus granulosus]|uniref:Expressed conserved protein n=1 Tax=Echinococcus granulosus TaxID=6210 RepID=A0A068WID0_ECHGR|nr:hypothetical protein ECG_06387 [Echinococcus granulosus]CDS19525.1 expressed conserved protein [Echinococcus granulosus]
MSNKPQLTRESTMAVTTKAGKEFLGDEKLGDTRLGTQSKRTARKATLRKGQSIRRTIEEAKLLLGSSAGLADVNSARQLRKHSAPILLSTPRRVNKKGAGRPPKKAKAETPAATATAAANSASADGATTTST